MIFLGVQIDGELEKQFLAEESEKHQKRAELLRAVLTQHFEIEKDPLLYLLKNSERFQNLMHKAVSKNMEIEAAKAKLEIAEKMAELKEKQKKQAALDHSLSREQKVDWGGAEGGVMQDENDQPLDSFAYGER